MRKRLIYLLLSCLSALLVTGCVEEINNTSQGTETEVHFSLNIDDIHHTRAISDGTSVDSLIYAIFTSEGELVSRSGKPLPETFASSLEMSMYVTLAQGCCYKAVFWAQSSKCDAYTLSDDMVLAVNYEGANNDENRDAFYGVSTPFTLSDNSASVTLKRPFAQLNAGAYPFDWEYVTGFYNFDVTKSVARVRDVADTLNLWDGSVYGSIDALFAPGAIPQESLYADVDEDSRDEEYTYLSMSYILAGTEPTTHSVDFYFLDENNQAIMFDSPALEEVTLQRNCHTDFVGQVLSNEGELNPLEYVPATEDVEYNVSEPTTIANKLYTMSGHNGLVFGSEDGQKVTMNNVYITGDIWTIELGGYRGPNYVNYNNELNNVVLHNLSTTSAIECHEWYFSPAVIAYGNTVVNNCTMTGATTVREPITDKHGVAHEVIPVDFGVRNESDAVINGGRFGTVFAWTHAVVDIHGAKIDTLYCGTCDSTDHSWMTIHSGTTIDKVICCEPRCPYGKLEYSTTMTIKSGAVIGSLQLVSTDVEFLIIEPGAKVGKITCDGVEYSYDDLRAAMQS